MKCLSCGEKFDSTSEHVFEKNTDNPWQTIRADHADYFRELEDSNWHKPCFCGGRISTRATHPESWYVECDDCGFLFDED